jgi:zinc transporter ZupT
VFTIPFGPLVPSLAIVIALAILAGATPQQLKSGALALAAGGILYLVAMFSPSARRVHAASETP